MAKRKRKVGEGGGVKLKIAKNYQHDQYAPYIMGAESGIVRVWQAIPDLTDGDVRQALRQLIKMLDRWEIASDEIVTLTEEDRLLFDGQDKVNQLQAGIVAGLSLSYKDYPPLHKEDVIGVLKQINYSIGNMNRGLRLQNYLHYVRDLLNSAQGKDPEFWDDLYDQMGRMMRS